MYVLIGFTQMKAYIVKDRCTLDPRQCVYRARLPASEGAGAKRLRERKLSETEQSRTHVAKKRFRSLIRKFFTTLSHNVFSPSVTSLRTGASSLVRGSRPQKDVPFPFSPEP